MTLLADRPLAEQQGAEADVVAGGDGAERVAGAHGVVAAGEVAASAALVVPAAGDGEALAGEDHAGEAQAVGRQQGVEADAVAGGDAVERVAGAHGVVAVGGGGGGGL